MGYRPLRIPVWLMAAALFATGAIGRSAGPAARPDGQPGFQIVTPEVSNVYTQDVTPEIAWDLRMTHPEGVLVSDVMYSPLRPGDVILAINGNPVRCQRELDWQLSQVGPGQIFFIEVFRDGRMQTVSAQRAMEPPPPPVVLQGTAESRGISVAGLADESGVMVTGVQLGTPASDVGLKAGDIILDVDAHPVRSAGEFSEFMRQLTSRNATFNVLHPNGQIDVFVIPSLWNSF
jgi:serine protease Do